ncbi:MAG: 4-hydroxy-tetrahydrodipicolinate reductase [Rhodoblastus sp.]
MADMRLVVMGAGGRMGRALVKAITEADGVTVCAALERAGSPSLGKDAGELAGVGPLGVPVTEDALQAVLHAEGIVDFTAPAATIELAALAAQARIAHIIGTTGLSEDDLGKIAAAARHAPIVRSGNMSLGVNVLAVLVQKAAAALGPDWDIEILEMHHRMKVDAPSGTALLLGEAAARGRQINLAEHSVRSRDGHTGARKTGDIGFATLRGGSVIGEHSVMLATSGERITLSHHAEDRSLFANGAIRAALWAHGRKPGLYSMLDVLGLND